MKETNRHIAMQHARDTFINRDGMKGVAAHDQNEFFKYVQKIEKYLNDGKVGK